jgi:hypothetical protein
MPNAMVKVLTSLIIFFTTFSHDAIGQVKKTMHFSSRDGMFCSQTMILDSSGLFFNVSGCEGRANISFGRYTLDRNNKISFQYLPFDSIKPVAKIIQEENAKANDSLITITFYDRYNRPLGFNFGIRLGDTSNQVHEMWSDEIGRIQVNRFQFKYVSLVQFLTMYREVDGIPIRQKSLQVYLNFPLEFLTYPELRVDQPRKLNLQLTPKGLYSITSKVIVYGLD